MNEATFLKEKYDLHNAPEVASAAKRTQKRTGEPVPNDPVSQIENYLDRFREIVDRADLEARDRGIRALKKTLYDKFVIRSDKIPETYWENQKRLLRERGQGADLEQVDWSVVKEQNAEAIVADQKGSLDNWVDYLASEDATYPDWLKYWTMRSVLSMGNYDKEKKAFPKRSGGTTKPFPELNREALAYVLDAIKKKQKVEKVDILGFGDEDKVVFEKLLHVENFARLYAWAVEKVTPATIEQLHTTEGRWVKYPQNSDHMPLVASLQGHGTGWCTAGESTAATQLKGGDFYVYYSFDQNGKPTIPRAAIRMEGGNMAEVRGVAPEQNLDPGVNTIVQDKLKEFPDGLAYEKKVRDMKLLTAIENKAKAGQELTKEDLIFLYEIDNKIEGFGYRRDPRIRELRNSRGLNKDILVVFECTSNQIAHDLRDIGPNTKAYVGRLVSGIFDHLPKSIEHIYTVFPEGKIRQERLTIGGETALELRTKLLKRGVQTSVDVEKMMFSRGFVPLESVRTVDIVRLRVSDLGFNNWENSNRVVTSSDLFKRAQEIGLEPCPAEVGIYYRLFYMGQPLDEIVCIGMKPIVGPNDRCLSGFRLEHDERGLHLNDYRETSSGEWDLDLYVVLCRVTK